MTDTTKQRAAFEAKYGPKETFAWRDANGNYKLSNLQSACDIWQAAWQAALSQAAPDVATWQERAEALPRAERQDERPFMRAEIAELRAALASRDKDAEITAAALSNATLNRACKELPEGYSIEIELENGYGGVRWSGPDCEWHNIEGEGYLNSDVDAAIDAAMAKERG